MPKRSGPPGHPGRQAGGHVPTGGVQIRIDATLPLEPRDLAALTIYDRIEVYRDLDLSAAQREAAEGAVRIAKRRAT